MSFVMMDIDQARKLLEFRWYEGTLGKIYCRGCDSLKDDSWDMDEDSGCPPTCPWWQLAEDVTEAE